MNKIQVKGDEKIQRKRRTRAIAQPQLAASLHWNGYRGLYRGPLAENGSNRQHLPVPTRGP